MVTFMVSYEITTEESAMHGDCETRVIVQGLSLRDAIASLFHTRTNRVDGTESIECNEYPVRDPRWVTVNNGMEYETGEFESRSLHLPDSLSAASRVRIAKLCGVK